ncbi:TetR/AcrR family transcriptional regulator [Fibrella aquatilis]|uniref:TetR/AcrR family transcriptional regulator n=1 Tax=Fibrella aquatilis TaxID=2817059 RepID=A0A939G398_9BACT|nr:TetR/AcrR family transcriptional regulator [Fibrella aquatilis]MBO0930403.1 TetR/AcrR family transcriptional regulator [Fibrella aquatilis]
MTRDRLQTENRLIDAIHELLTEEGISQIKINRVAQHAKVNKILIYRYFGGIEGLLNAYYKKYKPVIDTPPIDIERLKGAPLDEFFQACCEYVITEFRQLRNNPQAQSFLKNDLMAYQPGVVSPFADQKSTQFLAMIDELSELIQSENGRAFSAIIVSGMTLLTFMAQDKRTVFGVDLSTEEGWANIESALQRIYQALAEVNKARIGNTLPIPPLSTSGQESS